MCNNIIRSSFIKSTPVLQQACSDGFRAIQSVQDKAWVAGNGNSLAKAHNAVLDALGCSRRASQKSVIHVVALLAKGTTIRCEARLVANRFLTRCTHQNTLAGVLVLLLLFPGMAANALEIRLGSGDFDLKGGVTPIADVSFSLPTTTLSITEPHYAPFNNKLFTGFSLDYFSSSSLNRLTDIASTPLTTSIPGFGGSITDQIEQYSSIPVPADYRVHGINLDLFLGYDLLSTPKAVFSAGLNTGVSLPSMKTRNLQSDANLVIDLLENFDTKIRSYKLGPVVAFQWRGTPWLRFNGSWIANWQTASLENDWIQSSVDLDGNYQAVALTLQFFPARYFKLSYLPESSFASIGWQREDWRFDKASIEVPGFAATTPPVLDFSFDHQRLFLGAGVRF